MFSSSNKVPQTWFRITYKVGAGTETALVEAHFMDTALERLETDSYGDEINDADIIKAEKETEIRNVIQYE